MKKQLNFFLPAIQKKYLKLYERLQRAVRSGRFALYAADKKQQLMQCLARYEKQLRICGKGVAVGAFMLLPSDGIFGQPVSVGGEFLVNSWTTGRQNSPSIAMDNNGDFVIVWSSYNQDGSDFGIYAQRYNSVGSPQGNEFRVNTYTGDDQNYPAVAMDDDGDFVIAWSSKGQDGSDYGIYAQRYNSIGVPQGSEFRVNTYTTNTQSEPSVGLDSDGDFVITWYSNQQGGEYRDVYAQRYNSLGIAQGSEFRVNSNTGTAHYTPSVAMDNDGNFVIAFSIIGNISAKRYNSSGVVQGTEFIVNTGQAQNYIRPSIAIDLDGDFVITWDNGLGIYARRYNNVGQEQGNQFQVNSFTTGYKYDPAIAKDSNGNFVISWRSSEQDGDLEGIYSQQYNSAGVPIGSEFRVNSHTTHRQNKPSIAMDNDGNFIVAWESYYQDGSQTGIYAQRFSATSCSPQNWYIDIDGDSYGAGTSVSACTEPLGYVSNNLDCDDNNFNVNPGIQEICNNTIDDDCDGYTDSSDPDIVISTWYQDNDGDGKGNPTVSQTACTQPSGYVSNNLDCDDNNTAVCPVPSGPFTTSITEVSAMANWTGTGCAQRYQFQYKRKVDVTWNYVILAANTFNFTFSNLQPGTKYQWRVSSVCDTVSNVVSALTAVQNFTTKYRVYPDTDLDGYGNSASSGILVATFPLPGYSLNNLDCNDSNNAINPGGAEICNNNLDDDCDGLTDGNDPDIGVSTWYQDNDGDGKGNPAVSQSTCSQPNGYVLNNLDCDDNNVAACPVPVSLLTSDIIDVSSTVSWTGTSCAQLYRLQYKRKVDANWIFVNLSANTTTYLLQNLLPGTKYVWRVSTICDSVSNVLSSPSPVQNFTTKYRVYPDADGDGYGNLLSAAVYVNALPAPGYALNNLDCLDSNGAVFPGAAEICNLIDDDCDGLTDEGFPVQTYYQDLDDDGYGYAGVTIQACTVPTGYVSNSTDCNDINFNIRPNAPEICNGGVDDDCDLLADDLDPGVTGQTTWYIDGDGDGLGSSATTILTCVPPPGYVGNLLDCNDNSSSPECLAPSGLNVSPITSNSATLSWINSPCVSYYAVQYRPNAVGSWLPASPFLVSGNNQLFTDLAPNTLYQYRIRAICNAINVNTPFIKGTFTTLPLPMALADNSSNGAMDIDFELYPNPGDGVFNLRLESGTEGVASVTVMDGLGKLAMHSGWSLSKGLNVTQFDLSGLPNGVYQLQVRHGEIVKSKKMVIVR